MWWCLCRFWGISEQTTRGSRTRTPPSFESSANSQDEPGKHMEMKSITGFICHPAQKTQGKEERRSIKHLQSTFNSNWKSVEISGLLACVWAFMIWQIYCITSWTAPPVDWQGVPAHIHFYIKFLLLYFLTGIFYVLCFCNTLYKICIKRLKAMHSVSS